MVKTWKAGDYIPVEYINDLEKEVDKLRKSKKIKPEESMEDDNKDKG